MKWHCFANRETTTEDRDRCLTQAGEVFELSEALSIDRWESEMWSEFSFVGVLQNALQIDRSEHI